MADGWLLSSAAATITVAKINETSNKTIAPIFSDFSDTPDRGRGVVGLGGGLGGGGAFGGGGCGGGDVDDRGRFAEAAARCRSYDARRLGFERV